MPKLSLLVVPAVLAIAIYLAISSFGTTPSEETPSQNIFPSNLVSIASGINTVAYDEQGAIAYTLQAERQIQSDDDTSELERPMIRLYEDQVAQWNIVADSGNISARQDGQTESSRKLDLAGDVELISLDDYGNRMTLNTNFLSISPEDEIANTESEVVFTSSNLVQTAQGMIANFAGDEITFLSNSEGRYVPVSD